MKKKGLAMIAGLALFVAVLAGYNGVQAQSEDQTILQIAQEDGNFTTLVSALNSTGLDEVLNGTGSYTVFAPTDAAFQKLDPELLENLTTDNETMKEVLLYHVVAEVLMSENLTNGSVATVQGETLNVSVNGSVVMINDAMVTMADINASNGVIHVIDTVLMPSNVTTPEQPTTPEEPTTPEQPTTPEEPAVPDTGNNTIVDIAMADGNFTCLVAALEAAGLVDELSGEGPFTVFAPTDAAFDKLDACLVQQLMDEDCESLKQILLYHVVDGAVNASDLSDCQKIETLQGGCLTVTINDDVVCINDAQVIMTDIQASNGVIHVIDTVLMPSDL